MIPRITKDLVAPCGMVCAVCCAYLAYKNDNPYLTKCTGCRARNKQCAFVKKGCAKLMQNKIDFCHRCKKMPCKKLKKISDKYTARHDFDFVANQKYIKQHGIDFFIRKIRRDFKCPKCGDLICVHNKRCFNCETPKDWRK